MKPVAVLFARADSVYKALPGVDVYDMERDARTYDGPHPVVAHPPCRAWGNFSMFAKPRPDERNLARLAVALVREFGGVLEHPAGSKLWPAQRLPVGHQRDAFGGWTLVIDQHWWGHRAQKRTKLYIVGVEPGDIPDMPLTLGRAECVVGDVGRAASGDDRPEVSKAEREHTPPRTGSVAGGLGATRHNSTGGRRVKPKTYPPGHFSAPVRAWPGLRDYVPVMAGDTDHTEKRRAAAAKGRETALEQNVGWSSGTVVMPGTPDYLAPGWMEKK